MGFYVPEEHQAAPPAPTGEVRGEGVTVVVIEHHHSWCKPGENGEMNPHQVSIVTREDIRGVRQGQGLEGAEGQAAGQPGGPPRLRQDQHRRVLLVGRCRNTPQL